MRFIGDIHGKIADYIEVAREAPETIQVGDFGVGFLSEHENRLLGRFHAEFPTGHRFIRGNHDNPLLCAAYAGYIRDGHYDSRLDTMFIGGAWSIDKDWRTPGVNWWPDEEVSDARFEAFIEAVQQHRPRIIVSHDAPHQVLEEMFGTELKRPIYRTRTAMNLQAVFEAHKPEYWVFGHWHLPRREVIDGTTFICLEELAYIDIEMDVREGV